MHTLRRGMEKFAATRLQEILTWMTSTPWRGLWSGTVLTAALQSSTALTVLAVTFVDAQLLSFQNALGLILGSNIGTTMTTQVLAFPGQQFALYALVIGALGFLFIPNRWRYLTLAILGLGSLFLALTLLQAGLAPIANHPTIQNYLRQLGDNHLQGILAGTVLSAILHSSSATTGLVMLLAEDGYITLSTALAFIFGANIGTCFTALLASAATSRSAQRVAIYHVLLNVFGVLIFYPLLGPLSSLLETMGGSLSRQVANAHTIFNVLSSLLAYPLLPLSVRLLTRLR